MDGGKRRCVKLVLSIYLGINKRVERCNNVEGEFHAHVAGYYQLYCIASSTKRYEVSSIVLVMKVADNIQNILRELHCRSEKQGSRICTS